ncbi:agamous-like MADS-box protein AGL61 [Diospyros lotus]|uniref:agamous-like MADS-box protein AGL61 n=1 Tax=Diospyros lotus TaxID=55363 RepID=UPI00224D6192|nr:agamous-like MADS-box protein AGL61 [Diospyros lotus]
MEGRSEPSGSKSAPTAKTKDERRRQVKFRKRRSHIFKKSSELSTLCGANVAVIAFSPSNKAYSFGSPNVNAVIGPLLGESQRPETLTDRLTEARRNAAATEELNAELLGLQKRLEEEKRRGRALDQKRMARQRENWWEAPIEEMELEQLERLKVAMEEVQIGTLNQVAILTREKVVSNFEGGAPPSAGGPPLSAGGPPPSDSGPSSSSAV